MERRIATLRDLLIGDRVFRIPVYQRHYSWNERHWSDLWDDVYYLDPGKRHFFGTVLLKKTGKVEKTGMKSFEVSEIIDGQQRICTVLLFLREILSQLRVDAQKDMLVELDRLEEDYLRYRTVHKLELLGDDREFFKLYVIEGQEYPDETLTISQRQLRDGKTYFRKRIEELKTSRPSEWRDLLVSLYQNLGNMELIRYDVEDDSDAVLIFETVNNRGKRLTDLERTKSFLMHTVYLAHPEDPVAHLERINDTFSKIFRWFTNIIDAPHGEDFRSEYGEDTVQRYHFIIYETRREIPEKYRYDTRTELSRRDLDVLREKFRIMCRTNRQQCLEEVLKYVNDLGTAFFVMQQIVRPGEDEVGKLLERLFVLRRVANFYPLLVALWTRYRDQQEEIRRVLELIEVLVFRIYAIGRRRADVGVDRLSELAYTVHQGSSSASEVLNELKSIISNYERDRSFEVQLRAPEFYDRISTRDKKYLLHGYEQFLRCNRREPLDITLNDVLSDEYQIEHVWARDPSMLGLSQEQLDEHEVYKDRLGNLTVASRAWNASWGNAPFETKRGKYQDSVLRVQKELADSAMWGKEQIESREKEIIQFALSRWAVDRIP